MPSYTHAYTIYDRITITASNVIGAPVSLVSMVGDQYQFFKSMVGLPEPWASHRIAPRSHPLYKHCKGRPRQIHRLNLVRNQFVKSQ